MSEAVNRLFHPLKFSLRPPPLMVHPVPFLVLVLGRDLDPFIIPHLFAALAEKERAMIGARTKAALAAAKVRHQPRNEVNVARQSIELCHAY